MDTLARIEELERKFDENPRRYFAALANELRKTGQPDRAIKLCELHLVDQPQHLSGHVVLAQALLASERRSDAEAELKKALEVDAENVIALRLLGVLASDAGDTAAARQYLARVLEIDPTDQDASAALAALEPATAESEPEVEETKGAVAVEAEVEATVEAEVAVPSMVLEAGIDRSEPAVEPDAAPVSVADVAIDAAEPVADAPEEREIAFEPGREMELEAPAEPDRTLLLTETMADLYLAQGHRAAAIDVLRRIADQRPDDERIRARLAALQAPPVARTTVRDFFAQLARPRPS